MIHPDIPQLALSVQNPWPWLIVHNFKPLENRDWRTSFRGPFAIHAGKQFDRDARQDVIDNRHPVTGDLGLFVKGLPKDFMDMASGKLNGGIVGVAEIVDCVEESDDPWFVGKFGFVIANARPVPFIPCPGALSFFDWRKALEKAEAKKAAA